MTKEVWRDVPDTNYQVSSLGRVRTVKILKQNVNEHGYHKIAYRWKSNWVHTTVHRLVALAFMGPCPKGKEVNHIDGNKLNNRPSNLEYVTRKENAKNALDRNAYKRGQEHYQARITIKQAKNIRAAYKAGEKSMQELALYFDTSKATIHRIIKRSGRWA